jgi:sugar-specific transcriptional regulator TrmB
MEPPELINRLTKLGLSVNQAKIYLFLATHDQACAIKDISRNTKVHTQDIYRILKDLEEKGLVLKEMCNPLKVQAIEPKEALSELISLEKQDSAKRIQTLKLTAKDLSRTIKNMQKNADPQEQTSFNLLSTKKPFITTAASTLNQAKKRYWLAQLVDRFISPQASYKSLFKKLSSRKVNIRVLLFSRDERNKKYLEAYLQEMKTWKANFEIKCADSFLYKFGLVIIDDEVWIGTKSTITSSFGSTLRTNDPSFLYATESIFLTAWNSPQAKLLLSKQHEEKNNTDTHKSIDV